MNGWKQREECRLTTELNNFESIDNFANEALNAVGAGRVGCCLGTHEFKLFVFKF